MDLNAAAVIFMGGYVLVIVAAGLVMSIRPGGSTVRFLAAGGAGAGVGGCGQAILLGGEAEVMGNFRGHVQSVLLGATSGKLEQVTLASGGGLIEGGRVPASAIVSADGRMLQIGQEWSDMSSGGEAEGITLQRDAAVVSVNGKRIGRLRLVCFDRESGLVRGLIVANKRRPPGTVFLPIHRVKSAGAHRIDTDLGSDDISALQPFASDDAIKEAVVDRLNEDPAIRAFARSLRVEVRSQRVGLSGYVKTQAQAEKAAAAARSVPGVLAVDRGIHSDEDLARAVLEAISRDLGTSSSDVEVRSDLGQVDIVGRVADRQALRRVETAAGRVPGVLVMHNLVTIG